MDNRVKAWLAFAGVAFFWGTTFLAIKVGVQTMPPFLLAGSRHFIGGVLICSCFLLRGNKWPEWKQLRVFVINGFLLLVLGNGLVTWAEKYISSGLAALICALTPLSIIIMNMAFGAQKEKLKAQAIIGIGACLAAQVIIFRDNLKELADPNYMTGVLFIGIAIISWGLGSVYSKNNQTGITPLYGAGLQMLSAGVMLLIFGSLMGEWPYFKPDADAWYSLAYLVVFGSLIAFSSYMYVLKQLPATIVSTYAYINTIVAVLLGWLWLDEKMNAAVVIAVALTIAGVWLVSRSFTKKEQ